MVLGDADSILIQTLLGFITALGGAVGIMYRSIVKRLDDCESDREALWRTIADLRGVSIEKAKEDGGR